MKISHSTNTNFKGYDVLPLKGLYMQGLVKRGEINIFREIKAIAKKEGIDLFFNQNNSQISDNLIKTDKTDKLLSVWGQDRKAFVKNKNGETILWNRSENVLDKNNLGGLKDFNIFSELFLPRGGNYYLGYKPNGEKWLLINGMSIYEDGLESSDLPKETQLTELFGVNKNNIYKINKFSDDLDEKIRPIGYPYILVNDFEISLQNLKKMKEKFPQSSEVYTTLKDYINNALHIQRKNSPEVSADETCDLLKSYGFKPIKIGGRYSKDINYMNAIAFENNQGKISYITNSTKKSYPELQYLEQLFEEELREKVPNISNTYFVSGGKRPPEEKNSDSLYELYSTGLKDRNVIMDILANRGGGIHCMTTEIPDFEKIESVYNK